MQNPAVEVWYKRTGVRGKGREKRLQFAFAANLAVGCLPPSRP